MEVDCPRPVLILAPQETFERRALMRIEVVPFKQRRDVGIDSLFRIRLYDTGRAITLPLLDGLVRRAARVLQRRFGFSEQAIHFPHSLTAIVAARPEDHPCRATASLRDCR